MAQQQQNITISAPGFQGLNTEDSPIDQNPGFCRIANNAIVDQFGRIGSRKAFAEYTTAVNVTYSADPAAVTTNTDAHAIGFGDINGTDYVLTTVSVTQKDAAGATLQQDYFLCKLTEASPGVFELDELTYPTLTDNSTLVNAKILGFRDKVFIFSAGNECMVYDGTTVTSLFTGTIDVDYIPPTDDTGVLAAAINGEIATAAYGRLWVAGVGGDYSTIYYSDLLVPTQWYDGRGTPVDAQNTAGILDVSEYWPNGSDRIRAIVAHNGALYVFGRESILVYNNAATGDPAGTDGIFLADTITNMGALNQDAVININSDVLFVDDSGVRSLGRTIQEKSVPIGDLSYNVRGDIQQLIANTPDDNVTLSYWPNESLIVALFPASEQAYVFEKRQASATGGFKATRWNSCKFNRMLYAVLNGETKYLLTSNDSKGLLAYEGNEEYNNKVIQFEYVSNLLTFGQSANAKFLKQVDFTVVNLGDEVRAFGGWGFTPYIQYNKEFTIPEFDAALYDLGVFNTSLYALDRTEIRRYKVNTKGSGDAVCVGIRADVRGASISLQEINVQTLLGRII